MTGRMNQELGNATSRGLAIRGPRDVLRVLAVQRLRTGSRTRDVVRERARVPTSIVHIGRYASCFWNAEERQPVEKKSEKEGERPKSLRFGEERRGSGSFCYTMRGQRGTPPGICKDMKGKGL